MQSTQREDVLTVRQVASELNCSPGLVRKLVKSGALPATRISGEQRGAMRILAADVVSYLDRINEQP